MNKANPHIKASLDKNTNVFVTADAGDYDARKMFQFQQQHGSLHGWYMIRTLVPGAEGYNILIGPGMTQIWKQPSVYAYWKIERVIDNLGDDWDYYKLTNQGNMQPLMYMENKHNFLHVGTWKTGDHQLWRLVPRYRAEDDGYIQIQKHKG